MMAEEQDKVCWCFESIGAFKRVLNQLSKEVPIYIDSQLGPGAKGEEYAKELYEQGFHNLYLASGASINLKGMPWIKKAVGKEPPFG